MAWITVNLEAREDGLPAPHGVTGTVRTLGESCKWAVDWIRVSNCGNIVGKVFFADEFGAENGFAWLWEQRLHNLHSFVPTVALESLRFLARAPSIQNVFLSYVASLRQCASVTRCQKEISDVDMEISKVEKLLRRRNSLAFYNNLLGTKEGLKSQKELFLKKLTEFETMLSCLEMHIQGINQSFEDVVTNEERPPVVLGKDWTWEQLHYILLRECCRFDVSLPIYSSRLDIIQAVHFNQVMVLIGETGSGKTTQLVQFLADSGFGFGGSLVCTQPRKVAATSVSERVAAESKGCYSEKNLVTCNTTYVRKGQGLGMINFMTDHVLLQMCMSDTTLPHISCIVVDEAHERSLSTDLLLALIKRLLCKREDLRVIIMSATADAMALSSYFCDCKVFHVKGRNFPVDIKYVGRNDAETTENNVVRFGQLVIPPYASQALKVVADIHAHEEEGTILCFLTSQAEVEWARDQFRKPSAMAFALHGKLSLEEQVLVFEKVPPGIRKVIFATNVAETSLTIPDVKFVVDSGMSKESRFDPKTGMNILQVGEISQSAAAQRSGRAGRTQPGICYRLYEQEQFDSMQCHRDPEILRVHLGIAILKLLALGVEDFGSFDFVQAPSEEAISIAVKSLIQLGLVTDCNGSFKLAGFGSKLVKLGVEPRMGKILLDCYYSGLGREGLVLASLMADSGNIFCRFGSEEDKTKSDSLKLRFCQQDGDLFTLMHAYKEWENEPSPKKKRWCWNNSINSKSMLRCRDAIKDMEICLKNELNITIPRDWTWSPYVSSEHVTTLKKILLASMAENLAMFSGFDRSGYDVAATRQQAFLHPSSSILALGQKPKWVVFGQLLCTSKQYLVCVTVVEEDWILSLQPKPAYDVLQLSKLSMQRKVISRLGIRLLSRICGKSNCNIQRLERHLQEACNSKRISIRVEREKQEIHLFSVAEYMHKLLQLVNDTVNCEKRWINNECLERFFYFSSHEKQPPIALLGPGAEIKHLQLDGKYITVELHHPNVNSLNDQQLLLKFENLGGKIACHHKFPNGRNEKYIGKWGTITFYSSEAAEAAVCKLNDIEVEGFPLSVHPLSNFHALHSKGLRYPAVKAVLSWPRRRSKGVAIITCATEDVPMVVFNCNGRLIGRSFVHCKRGKKEGSVFMTGLDEDVTDIMLSRSLKNLTDRRISDVFIIRYPAADLPKNSVYETSLLKELSAFVPGDKCQVMVYDSKEKACYTRVQVTFDGSIHLKAARALTHLEGNALSCCLSWQKINCQQTFYSTLMFPYSIYAVMKEEIQKVTELFHREYSDVVVDITRTEFGPYRVKVSSNKMESVGKCRMSLDRLLEGTLVADDYLDSEVKQILYTQEGMDFLESLERKTDTCIIFEKHSSTVKVYGPADRTIHVVKDIVEGLLLLNENKSHKIALRGEGLPPGLMKEIVKTFGIDLARLKESVPEAEFVLDTHRHFLCVQGSKEDKEKVKNIVAEIADNLKGIGYQTVTMEKENNQACPICLCDIENAYKLEDCDHVFCRSCLIDQCRSSIQNKDGFPLVCAHENCKSMLLVTDLKSLLSDDQLNELFRASVAAYVASQGSYRFCSTPDCFSVYEVSASSELFVCGQCSVELCTSCHLEYHPYLSCEKYKEFKQDPDASLKEWCRDKTDVKCCPTCHFTIEKTYGCNHMTCRCGKHICWVCLESFNDSGSCYNHLNSVHRSIS